MLVAPARAQLNPLYSFGETCPYQIVASNGSIFTVLSANGGNNPVFSYDIKTGVGKTIYTLPGEGRLVAAGDGILYGWVAGSGESTTMFSFNPANNAYQSLHVFAKGAPTTLTYHNGVLYGTDNNGGAKGQGTVFRYKVATGEFKTLFDFSGTPAAGNDPAVAPVVSGGYLYVLGSSALLKISAGNGKVIWDSSFSPSTEGGFGTLLALHHGTLYGANQSYGANGNGTIFSADPTTGAVSVLYSFSASAMAEALLFHGETLFGSFASTQNGGLFTYAVATGTYAEPYDFPASTEASPYPAVSVGHTGYVVGETSENGGTCSLYSFPL